MAAAQAKISGPEDVYVKKGSTISLTCTVNVHSTPPSSVSWHHGVAIVDFDSPRLNFWVGAIREKSIPGTWRDKKENEGKSLRAGCEGRGVKSGKREVEGAAEGRNARACVHHRGGVSLETEKTESGTTSKLLVTQARLSDSGNYTCIPSNANPASVMVHVLNGECYTYV
ncbi:uncharacterized protein LOC124413624 [Diprion similis]|uniref:uncharacterized protein LOC124413624 n=1 Tax=Diprion similis TaxID=362088 RepID=UPI001EF7C8E8|nr:uncharacterized protein LOC124413624 [Diprion similis]